MTSIRVWMLAFVVASGCGSVVKDKAQCGDGMVSGTEECDLGAANGQPTSCCTADCKLAASGTTCRASASACDVAETCNGTDGTCPTDMHMPDGMSCSGNGVNVCSAADTCMAGVCANNDLAAGTPCNGDACNLDRCAADGSCAMKSALKIAIIESESVSGASQNMDTIWQTIATGLGHTATILPQTALDDINGLLTYDILIVSGFDIPIPTTRRTNIRAFVEAKRGVYLQGEYLATYEGNAVFLDVANQLGAGFTWGADLNGQLTATATGCFATTPNAVVPMGQNYGVTGSSVSTGFGAIETDASGAGLGFRYCRSGGGELLVTTDKDNIRAQSAGVPEFMKNLIYRMAHADTCQ